MKDHKNVPEGHNKPARPICGATCSHNGQLSHMLSIIINAIADHYDTGTETDSTEDMIANINHFNSTNTNTNMTIISMDVKALYPSLDVKEVAKTVADIYIQSKLEIQGIEWEEACKYLALLLTPTEIDDLGLKEVVHQRKHKRGRPPGITTAEVGQRLHQPTEAKDSVLNKPHRQPTKEEERKIMAKCLELMILACMQNHTYLFNNTIRLQTKGGAIGLKVTQALARLYMLWWDQKFLKIAKEAGAKISMYKRYVDDTNIIIQGIEPNTEWDEESKKLKTTATTTIANDPIQEAMDVRTAREIKKIANSISQFIQWEEAVPSNSINGKLPILDLQCWPSNSTTIMYEFYRKPMANTQIMLYNSAMPEQIKRKTSSQEVIRILRNCHPNLPWQHKAIHLNQFAQRLRTSGYPEKMRAEIIQSGLKGYNKMREQELNGGRPVNRRKEDNRNQRRKEKSNTTRNWYKNKNNKYHTVLFVPCTPRGTLAKRLREVEERGHRDRGWRVKVVEMSGQTIRSQISKANPWPNKTCEDPKCFPCKEEKGGGNCQRKNVGYCITCKACKAEYHGETSRNMLTRGEEHLRALENKSKNSVLWNHCVTHHQGEETPFTMKATGYYTEPLTRQINEAVRIHHCTNLMNRKGEWRKTAAPRPQFIRE